MKFRNIIIWTYILKGFCILMQHFLPDYWSCKLGPFQHIYSLLLILQASKDSVILQISEGRKLINSSIAQSFALIIDGKSLTYALEDGVKDIFLQLAVGCASVICCRSSPKQKALVRSGKTFNNITALVFYSVNSPGIESNEDITELSRSHDLLKVAPVQ